MQKVAAYLLERRVGMEDYEVRSAEIRSLRERALVWLCEKGGTPDANAGTFKPEDNGTGSFTVEEAIDGARSCWVLQLRESTAECRCYTTTATVTSSSNGVSVYVSVEVGWATARIVPTSDSDPRCPRIVRSLLDSERPWYHGASIVRPLEHVLGFDAGLALAADIERAERSLPIVVVSTEGGRAALPQLDERLAYDLAGLANVVGVDEDASWALTDILGVGRSCFRGAIRLYWPSVGGRDHDFHPLWTAERLRSTGELSSSPDRFRKHLRGLIFPAAARSIARPREIDAIRDAAERDAATTLRNQAFSLEEFRELATSYANDVDKLRDERTSLRATVDALETQVAKLDADRKALTARLAEKSLSDLNRSDEFAPEAETSHQGPKPGETRFYKKQYSAPTHDILVRVQDCGCNRWEGANSADKARKGIAKLEGRKDINHLQHCASCTGGGVWKARW